MKTFYFLLLLMLVMACNRKSEEAILARGSSFRLIRTDYYGSPASPASFRSTHYNYDENNLLREIISENTNGAVDSKQVYRWTGGNTLRVEQHFTNPPWSSSIQSGQPLKIYSYDDTVFNPDTTLRKRDNYSIQIDNKTEYRSTTTFEYEYGKQIKRKNIYTSNGKLASYTLLYYDNRGNVTREDLYTNVSNTDRPNSTTTYEYDNAPNPYRTARLNSEISWYMSANNIVRQTSVNLVSGISSDEQWTYEYRPDGYPARQVYTDGRKEEFIYNQ
ncbi:hypothetical protein GCM10028803_12270 [Larkinella knui]|uniref:Uncharacterized protein n=1 Tax=Larkinella knui TaxID=2025310 RepID=A0A3P1CD99_9BACT|nr:hypothetical protein [Larkinella knui]RRB10814.1 hypothetical protein EHT87_27080 [Larkinella knui]